MKISKLLKICCIVTVFSILFFSQFHQVFANSEKTKEIDIMTSPEKMIFDIENFKPGDKAIRTVTIKNSGSKEFDYVFSGNRKSGSKKLYNELIFTISDKTGIIYEGKLSDFSKLKDRPIDSKGQDELELSVEFPAHLGNDFQGLDTVVEFKFYAEGTFGGVIPVDNSLPETATNSFNLLSIGAILVIVGVVLFVYQKRRKQNI